MPVWAYYLDEFMLVSDYDFNYTVNELIGIAVNEAERHGLKPTTVCHLKIDNDVIIEVRSEDGLALKLIKAKDPISALKRFYENEKNHEMYTNAVDPTRITCYEETTVTFIHAII